MRTNILTLIPLLAAAGTAQAACEMPANTNPIATAKLIIENNAGDGDMGVHGYLDDHGWREICLFDPSGNLIVHIKPEAQFHDLGLSGVFWESVEPESAEWGYEDLIKAFPEGEYPVKAIALDGTGLVGAAHVTHVVPSMPEILQPATVPEPDEGNLPVVPVADLTVAWNPVTTSLGGQPINIIGYQLTVEKHNYDAPHSFSRPALDVHVGPHLTSVTMPAALLDPASVYEIEVLAIEESGNQTIGGASFFATE